MHFSVHTQYESLWPIVIKSFRPNIYYIIICRRRGDSLPNISREASEGAAMFLRARRYRVNGWGKPSCGTSSCASQARQQEARGSDSARCRRQYRG